MRFNFIPYYLKFKTPFQLAHGTRTGTQLVYVEFEYNGIKGYGEASLPPYLNETKESVTKWLKNNASNISEPITNNQLWDSLPFDSKNTSAAAALEMSLINWRINKTQSSPKNYLASNYKGQYQTTFTISKSGLKSLNQKKIISQDFSSIKLKLTGKDDDLEFAKEMIKTIDRSFCVDINQGILDKEKALILILELEKIGCFLVEQPLKKTDYEGHLWLKNRVSIPIIADESIQNLEDLQSYAECFDGVNIKLMKCGGILRTQQMLDYIDNELNSEFIKLIGCMSESSLGVGMATTLLNRFDYADLDGPLLVQNDPFNGYSIQNAKINVPNLRPNELFKG